MEPGWLAATADETFYSATIGRCSLSVFGTMFGNYSYLVSRGGRTKAGHVGDLETAKT